MKTTLLAFLLATTASLGAGPPFSASASSGWNACLRPTSAWQPAQSTEAIFFRCGKASGSKRAWQSTQESPAAPWTDRANRSRRTKSARPLPDLSVASL